MSISGTRHFDLIGIANQVQFGKNGSQWRSSAGVFFALAADGATLVRLAVADPQSATDAVTFAVHQAAVANVTAQIDLVRSHATTAIATMSANVASLTTMSQSQAGTLTAYGATLSTMNTTMAALVARPVMNPAAVAMTGGTLDNVVIGATRPAAASFSTITVDMAVMDGGVY